MSNKQLKITKKEKETYSPNTSIIIGIIRKTYILKQLMLFLFTLLTVQVMHSQITIGANTTSGCTPLPISIQVIDPAASSISSYAWEITFPDNSVVTASSNSYTANLSQPGTYDVSLTINGTTTETWPAYITVHDLPTADFSVDVNSGCFPLCVEFTDNSIANDGAITSWSWDFGDGTIGTGNQPTSCYQNPGVYSPFLSITDEFGCFADVSMPGLITVSDQFPTSSFIPSSLLDCNAPVPIDFINTSIGSSTLTSQWDFGDGQTANSIGANDETHVFDVAGDYTICLQVTDEIGCENTSCQDISVFNAADAEFTVSETSICQGQVIDFQNETVLPPQEFQWDFDGDGTVDSNEENPSFIYPTPGNYEPQLTVYYSDNCENTQVFSSIDIFDQLLVEFQADTTSACSVPFDVNFTSNVTGGGNLTYDWIINGVSEGNTPNLSFSFTDYGSYTITLTVTNDVGCEVSEIRTDYIIIAHPSVDYTIPESLCSNESFTIANVTVNSVDPIGTWEWDFNNDGNIDANEENPSYVFPASGNFSIALNFITENGCVPLAPNVQNISVADPITNSVTISDTLECAEHVISFCIEDMVPEMTGVWNFGDGGGNVAVSELDSCLEYHFLDTGYFDLSLTLSLDGCQNAMNFPSAVYILGPVARFETSESCEDQLTVEFLDNSIQGENLIWNFGDGSAEVFDDPNPSHTFPANGTYTVTLTAINNTIGCQDVAELDLTISDPNPNIIFSQTSGCPPMVVEIESEEPNPYWNADFGNGTTIEASLNENSTGYEIVYIHDGVTQNLFINGATANFWPDITYENEGVYDVSVNIIDENGCEASVFYEDLITINSSPDFATFTMNVVEGCDSVYLNFTPDLPNLIDVNWSFNNGMTSTEYSPNELYSAPYPTNIEATFTASDNLGCTSTVTDTFSFDFPAVPQFSLTTIPQCIGDELMINNTSIGDIASFSWDFGDPASGASNTSTEENPTHFYSENGTFDICLTAENNFGCSTTSCLDNAVTINNPTAEFTYTSNVTNCNYGVSFVNTSAGTISCSNWDFGDNQTGIGTTVFHTYSIGVYDVTLVVCNDLGCVDTLVQNDILNFGDVVGPFNMILDDTPCPPFTVDFEAYNLNDNTFEYFWDFADGFGDSNSNTTSHDYTAPGTFCPSLIMTDPNGCSALISCQEPFTVNEFNVVTSQISAICTGDSLLYTVTGGDTYTWDDLTDITTINDSTFVLHPTTTTNFTLNATLSDCQTTEEFNLIVHELPVVNYTIQDEICHQADTFLLTGGMPNDIPGTYYVNGNVQTLFDPSWEAGISYSIVYEYTDTNNCTNQAEDQIFINPLPSVTLEPFEVSCFLDSTIILEGASPLGGFFYDTNDSIITELSPQSHLGENLINYSFTDNNGCTNTASQNLTVAPNPSINIELGPACEGENLTVNNLSSITIGSIDTTVWSMEDQEISNAFQIETIPLNTAGDYLLELTLSSDNGCRADSSWNIHVSINPEAHMEFENACQDTQVEITNTSTNEEGEIINQFWTITGQEVSQEENLTHLFDNWGNYTLGLTVVNEAQCTNTATEEITIYPTALVDFVFQNNCLDNTSIFTNQTVTPSSNPSTIVSEYTWDFGTGSTSNEDYVAQYTYSFPGTYEVTLHAITTQQCQSSKTKEITIFPLPEVNIIPSTNEICQGADVYLNSEISIESPYTINNIYWNINGETVSSDPAFNYTVTGSNNLAIELSAFSDMGCFSSQLSYGLVVVHPSPVANFTFSPQGASISDPTVHFEDLSQGAYDWYYDFGDGDSDTDPNTEHTYSEANDYQVIQYVTNEYECMDTASVIVRIEPEIIVWVPNTFTPNDDGVNDFFGPVFYGFDFAQYHFEIYDRWGVKIFETTDPEEMWNGNFHNGTYFVADGVYNWQMTIRMPETPVIQKKTGSVNLLR